MTEHEIGPALDVAEALSAIATSVGSLTSASEPRTPFGRGSTDRP